jgi:hypothetical protein
MLGVAPSVTVPIASIEPGPQRPPRPPGTLSPEDDRTTRPDTGRRQDGRFAFGNFAPSAPPGPPHVQPYQQPDERYYPPYPQSAPPNPFFNGLGLSNQYAYPYSSPLSFPYANPPPSLHSAVPPGWGQAPPASTVAVLAPGPPAVNGGGESDIQSLCRLASQLVEKTGSVPQQLLDRIASILLVLFSTHPNSSYSFLFF